MNKVTLSGYILVTPSDLPKVRDALPVHISNTRAEEGCLVFSVEESQAEVGRFDVYEEFRSKEAFELHQERVSESDWGQITKNLVRNYSIDGLEE